MTANKLMQTHPLLSDRIRLSIMAALMAAKGEMGFNELIETLELTKGNLSSHIKKLEDAELIVVRKMFVGKIPKTSYSMTKTGKEEFKKYVKSISELL